MHYRSPSAASLPRSLTAQNLHRPMQAARYSKKGSKEAELGLLAMDALHKQVRPLASKACKGCRM